MSFYITLEEFRPTFLSEIALFSHTEEFLAMISLLDFMSQYLNQFSLQILHLFVYFVYFLIAGVV